MRPRRVAGTRLHALKVRELLADLEWERQRTVIAALLPYSGGRARRFRFPQVPAGAIPLQRRPSAAEQRVIRAGPVLDAHRERVLQQQNNRNPRI